MLQSEKKIEAQERTIETLQSQLKEKEVIIRRLEVRNSLEKEHLKHSQLENKYREMTAKATDLEHHMLLLTREKDSLQYEVDLLRNVVDLQTTSDDHVTTADALARCKKMEGELEQMRQRIAAAENCAELAQRGSEKSNNDLVAVHNKAKVLFCKVEQYEREMQHIVDDREEIRAELQQIKIERDKACESVTALEDAVTLLRQRLEDTARAYDVSQEQLQAAKEDSDGARRTWSEGQRQLSEAQQELSLLRSQLKEAENRVTTLEETGACVGDERSALEAHAADSEAVLQELSAENAALMARVTELERVEAHHDALRNLYSSVQERLDKTLVASRQASDEAVMYKEECEVSHEQLRIIKDTLRATQHRHESEKTEWERSNNNLAARVESLGHELAERDIKYRRLAEELEQALEKLAVLQLLNASQYGVQQHSIIKSPHNISVIQSSNSYAPYNTADSSRRVVHALSHSPDTHSVSPQSQYSLGCGSNTTSKEASVKLQKLLGVSPPQCPNTGAATSPATCRVSLHDTFALSPFTPKQRQDKCRK